MKNRLNVLRVTAIIIGVLLAGSQVIYAEPPPGNGSPFDEIRAAIEDLYTIVSGLQDQIDAIQLLPGPQGPVGPKGPQGPEGPPGSGVRVITTEWEPPYGEDGFAHFSYIVEGITEPTTAIVYLTCELASYIHYEIVMEQPVNEIHVMPTTHGDFIKPQAMFAVTLTQELNTVEFMISIAPIEEIGNGQLVILIFE